MCYHPKSLKKKKFVRALVDRARNIPSCSFEKNKEKQHVIHALTASVYPRWFIVEDTKPSRPVTLLAPKQTESDNFAVLPYVAGTSEPIKRTLDNFGVKTALKPVRKIGNLFPKTKDYVPPDQIRSCND